MKRYVLRMMCFLMMGLIVTPLASSANEEAGVPKEVEGEAEAFIRYEQSAEAFARARAASERGHPKQARLAYEEAVRLDETFVEAMVNLARLHVDARNYEKAENWLERAARVRTDYPELYKVRGLLALSRGNAQRAATELSRARQLVPEDLEVLANLGAALLEVGVLTEAESVLKFALQVDPVCSSCSLNLGLLAEMRGDRSLAKVHYRRFLERIESADPDRDAVEARLQHLKDDVAGGRDEVAELPAP